MDRSERLTTFGQYPQAEEPQPGFASDSVPATAPAPAPVDPGGKAETRRTKIPHKTNPGKCG